MIRVVSSGRVLRFLLSVIVRYIPRGSPLYTHAYTASRHHSCSVVKFNSACRIVRCNDLLAGEGACNRPRLVHMFYSGRTLYVAYVPRSSCVPRSRVVPRSSCVRGLAAALAAAAAAVDAAVAPFATVVGPVRQCAALCCS